MFPSDVFYGGLLLRIESRLRNVEPWPREELPFASIPVIGTEVDDGASKKVNVLSRILPW